MMLALQTAAAASNVIQLCFGFLDIFSVFIIEFL